MRVIASFIRTAKSAVAPGATALILLDISPTLTELCALTPPDDLDGRSLVPLLKDPKAPWESTAITGLCDKGKTDLAYISIPHEIGPYTRYGAKEEEFYHTTKDSHEWTNRDSYSKHFDMAFAVRPEFELYDLKSDPDQVRNVAADSTYARILRELTDRMMNQLRDTGDPRVIGDGTTFDQIPFVDPDFVPTPKKKKVLTF